MNLVERHIINKGSEFYKEADRVSLLSKNLYNFANYSIRQEFINTSKEKEEGLREFANYKNYYEMRKELAGQIDYVALPQKVANHTLRLLDKSWKSFFKSIKEWNKFPDKFLGKPGLPNYLDVEIGRYIVSYEKGAISAKELKKGFIKLSGTDISVLFINCDKKLISARIVPTKNNEYVLEIIYKCPEVALKTEGITAGIDIGVNNLMAIVFAEEGVAPALVNGRPLKSINQYYNKQKAMFQKKLDKAQSKKLKELEKQQTAEYQKIKGQPNVKKPKKLTQSTSNAIKKLTANRNHKIEDYMHKATAATIVACEKNNVKTIIVGKNKNWKQKSKMSKKTNQSFVAIPFARMIEMLIYKARLVGIKVIAIEESYTSKCSFFDLEELCQHNNYLGKRTSRGCFKTAVGNKINADINGAYNTIRKVAPDIFKQGVEGFAVNPLNLIIHK